jgi:hypothetical protein
VLRVPSSRGVVWFKASREAFSHEARVLAELAPLAPELLPEVIASNAEGWLLLEDAGDRAREHPVDWPEMLRAYARLQIDAAPLAERLLEVGAPDNRPQRVAERVESLMPWLPVELGHALRADTPWIEERMAQLSASRLPATIDHGDLHDGNVFSREGRPRLLDWGDSAVAHPFFSLSTAQPDQVSPYLEVWAELAPRRELDEEAAIVLELRPLIRALNSEDVAALGEVDHLIELIRRFIDRND